MRHKVIDMNKTADVADFGVVTVTKQLWVDTNAQVSNREAAKGFADEYAKQNGLKVVASGTSLNNWFENKVGMWFWLA